MTSTVNSTIDVEVPVAMAYARWTDFERFPDFLSGIDSVTRTGEGMLHWKVSIGGVEREFDAAVIDEQPNRVISWKSVAGPEHSGAVVFEQLAADRTRIDVTMGWEPEGFVEKVGAAINVDQRQVDKDLTEFKRLVEHEQRPSV